jgi:hypothetical protein
MATLSISNAFSDLFVAPLNAVVDAEEAYLQMWITRLKVLRATYVEDEKVKREANLSELLDQYVPVVQLEGNIDTSLTMRIAGVKEMSGSLSVGLALGPVHASGGFGFVSRNTHESVFQASTSFALANKEFSLKDYLKAAKITVATPSDLTKAIEHLSKDLGSRSAVAGASQKTPAKKKNQPK